LKSIEVSTICVLKIGCNFFSWWTSQEVKRMLFLLCVMSSRGIYLNCWWYTCPVVRKMRTRIIDWSILLEVSFGQ
jgi:hypothetical protein